MKVNWKVRFKNPYFWIGLAGVIFTATGLNPEDMTTWSAVWHAFLDFWKNPYMVVSVIIAIVGVVQDPTTSGLGDSARALSYNTPNVDKYVMPDEDDENNYCTVSEIVDTPSDESAAEATTDEVDDSTTDVN